MPINLPFSSPLVRRLRMLEWVLLGIVAIAQVLLAIAQPTPPSLISGFGLGLFAVLGQCRRCPGLTSRIYTVVELGLAVFLGLFTHLPLPALLWIVVVIRSCVSLQGQSRTSVTILSFLGFLMVQTYRLLHQSLWLKISLDQLGTVWFGFALVFGLVVLFLQLLVDAAFQEQQRQEQLAAANAQLRNYALRIEDLATVQERNRIAREIHDSLGHALTVFSIHLEAALRLLPAQPEQAKVLLHDLKHLNATTLQEVRQSVTALRTDPLQERSLAQAIADLVAEFQQSTGILPVSQICLARSLPQELNRTIYRIVQESLTNICKYAAATEVGIAVVQSASRVTITVRDNGNGFDLNQNISGFGLQGMQERTLALAGHLQIITAPGQGCCVQAIFPEDRRSIPV